MAKAAVSPTMFSSKIESELQQRFDHATYGIMPEHRFIGGQITVNDDLQNCIARGSILVRSNIESFTQDGVVFSEQSEAENVDVVVWATGYRFEFPFLESGKLVPVQENRVNLYKYIYPVELAAQHPTLGIIGLVNPSGPLMTTSEMQSRVFFNVLTGKTKLPTVTAMNDDIQLAHTRISKRYVHSERHTLEACLKIT